jgi:hypothetical protein
VRSTRGIGTVVVRVLLILVIAGVGRAVWDIVTSGPTVVSASADSSVPPAAVRSELAKFKVGQCVLAAGYQDPHQFGGSEYHVEQPRVAPCGDPGVARVLAKGSMTGVARTAQAVEAAADKAVPSKSVGSVVWDSVDWIALAPANTSTVIGP